MLFRDRIICGLSRSARPHALQAPGPRQHSIYTRRAFLFDLGLWVYLCTSGIYQFKLSSFFFFKKSKKKIDGSLDPSKLSFYCIYQFSIFVGATGKWV